MNPVLGVETHTKKTVLMLIVGAVVGILISAGIMAYLFRDSVVLTIPATNTGALSYPDQKVPDVKTNILLPKKLVSEEYYLLVNKIIAELNQAVMNNNATILPLMNTIKEKSVAQDFAGFFDLVFQARGEIKKNNDLLITARTDIATLRKVNDGGSNADIYNQTAVFLNSGDMFAQAFADYFSILNETLSGPVPTQALLDKLTEKIASLRSTGASFQTELNTLLVLIKQKYETSTP
ncbi:MAG: hypothetical protein Q7R59_02760 [bacterium]|nr:hypothetical protein [bacterium]